MSSEVLNSEGKVSRRHICSGCVALINDLDCMNIVNQKLVDQINQLLVSRDEWQWGSEPSKRDSAKSSSVDSNSDLKAKLIIIQKKLRSLEYESSAEIKDLLAKKNEDICVIESLRTKLSEAEKNLKESDRLRHDLESKLLVYKTECSGQETQLKSSLTDYENQINVLTFKLKSLQDEKEAEAGVLNKKYVSLQTQLSSLQKENSDLRNRNEVLIQERKVLLSQQEGFEKKIKDLEKMKTSNTENSEQIAELTATVDRLNSTIHRECLERTSLLEELHYFRGLKARENQNLEALSLNASDKLYASSCYSNVERQSAAIQSNLPPVLVKEDKAWANRFKPKGKR
jgi:chromosome segregation ATPase